MLNLKRLLRKVFKISIIVIIITIIIIIIITLVKEKKKKPYPQDPLIKIKLRSQTAASTNKMDLSTRDVWSDDDEISHSSRAVRKYHNPLRHDDHIHVDRPTSPTNSVSNGIILKLS